MITRTQSPVIALPNISNLESVCGALTCFVIVFNVEIIITAGGENIAPVPIEAQIKLELPVISNVVLIGDKRKFLSCLITIKVEKLWQIFFGRRGMLVNI